MDPDDLYRRAQADIEAGRHEDAQRRLAHVVLTNPRHEQAWLALALIVPEMDQAIDCLNRVLALNPHNAEALKYLDLAREEKRRDETFPGPASSAQPGGDEPGRLPRLGSFLVKAQLVSAEQLEAALAVQRDAASAGRPQRLGEILVEQGVITTAQLDSAVREQQGRFNSLFWD
jgi:tetratricopeptide (TPR) repeat protein